MSKKEKLITRLLSLPKDFTYNEMRTLLCFLGFEERSKGKTSGSRVEFIKGNDTILLHKPHPNNQLKPYQVKQIVETLKTIKLI
ncbi:MAG: type II toxin-antitoxin system HicA family toxin [Muribaculaceae bacterium]|nr:type II toxin-antitoxin system HicA family toxin [Muribaculaceae bacterium]